MTIADDPVRTLAAGDWFGEIDLLHDVPRTATVTARGQMRPWSLDRDAFLAVLAASPTGHRSEDGEPSAELVGAGLIV